MADWVLKVKGLNRQGIGIAELSRNGILRMMGMLESCYADVLTNGNDGDTYHEEDASGWRSRTQTVAEMRSTKKKQDAYIDSGDDDE